jgi:hypothetical protein
VTSGDKNEISEQWFERYLRDHDIEGGDDHHPELGDDRRPDYRVSRGSDVAICEVKEFTDSALQRRAAQSAGHAFTTSNKEEYGTVRNTISKAAKEQLRPFKDRGEALAVVLANPHGVLVHLDDPIQIVTTMYGNQAFSVPVGPGADPSDPGHLVFTDDGALTSLHRYLGAVITLHRRTNAADGQEDWLRENRHRWPETNDLQQANRDAEETLTDPGYKAATATLGDYYFVRVYSTISTVTGDAVPVPKDLFNGPHDQYWAVNKLDGGFELELVQGQFNDRQR